MRCAGAPSKIAPVLQVSEIRSTAADTLWLSGSYQRETIALHFTWLNRPDQVDAAVTQVEQALAPFEARPHWGKVSHVTAERVTELYPRLERRQGTVRDASTRREPLQQRPPGAARRPRWPGPPVTALTQEERDVLTLVADWVDREVRPAARELEHANTYPADLIGQMKELGIFGLAIPAPWGEAPVSMPCYALVTAELARGWMSLAGAMGGHTVVAKLLVTFGTKQQQDKYLPRMATGELRATMALTEPGGGSDLQAIRTIARRDETATATSSTAPRPGSPTPATRASSRCSARPTRPPSHGTAASRCCSSSTAPA